VGEEGAVLVPHFWAGSFWAALWVGDVAVEASAVVLAAAEASPAVAPAEVGRWFI